jgi:LCP family protein required for cell wall assembly
MPHQRRRLLLGAVLMITVIAATALLRVSLEMNQALRDVDAMIVPTVRLPATATPQGTTKAQEPLARTAVVVEPTAMPTLEPDPDEPVNILLLGTDTRPGEEASRTDAMILVHINPQSKRVSFLSIPRDLWVDIPGFGPARINSAYPIGERRLGKGYGGALAKETVSALVGVPVHHFMLVDFEGFKKVIDTIGGIGIDVPKAIDDPNYPTDDFRTVSIHFDPGMQWMSGEQALIYARTRHADSDFGRNQRQQQVLMAMFEQVRKKGIFDQITQLDDYTSALRDYIRTDLSRDDMLRLARWAPAFTKESVQRFAISPEMIVSVETPGTFAADPQALRQVVAEMTGSAGVTDPPTSR